MKVVILAGGLGTRIGEESVLRPKPMIEIGEKPILWHIMKIYSHFGYNEFVICLGYKGYQIKEYFANYYLHESDVTFDFADSAKMAVHSHSAEPWKVTLVNTGLEAQTADRLVAVRSHLGNAPFMMTYGDGLADVNIAELVNFHDKNGKIATVTAARPTGRFGALKIDANDRVGKFQEKPEGDNAWINAGFFVLGQKVFDFIKGEKVLFEREPMEELARAGELVAFKHSGFWQPMDTLRERNLLESMWQSKKAPWKVWKK